MRENPRTKTLKVVLNEAKITPYRFNST